MKNLKNLLRNAAMTQEQFAARMGTDQCNVSKWVNGKTKPTFKTIQKMLRVLKCEFTDLNKAR